MRVRKLHQWDLTPKGAVALQRTLATQVRLCPLGKKPTVVAGADISYTKGSSQLFAVVLIFKLPEMRLIEQQKAIGEASFPYLPGLLSFRELPILIRAFEKLKNRPDVVLCDGQGIAHPRAIGLASHLGLFLNLPTIGCAKSRLVGTFSPLEASRWSTKPLLYQGRSIGTVVRTRAGIRPLFISPGHLIDFSDAIEILKQTTGRYRIPEPTRRAHLAVNALRRSASADLGTQE